MNILKRVFGITILAIVIIVPIFAEAESQVTITSSIAETALNSGLRVTLDTEPVPVFDTAFFAAATDVDLNVGEVNGQTQTTAKFSLLVRRLVGSGVVIRVTGNPLLHEDAIHSIGYILSSQVNFGGLGTFGSSSGTSISPRGTKATETAVGLSATADYVVPSLGNIIQHQNIFTIYVQKDSLAPVGIYTGSVTFDFVTP